MDQEPSNNQEKQAERIFTGLLNNAAFLEYPLFNSRGHLTEVQCHALYLSFDGKRAQNARKELDTARDFLMYGKPHSFNNEASCFYSYGYFDMHDPDLLGFIKEARKKKPNHWKMGNKEFLGELNVPYEEYGHPVFAIIPIENDLQRFKKLFLDKIPLHITPTPEELKDYLSGAERVFREFEELGLWKDGYIRRRDYEERLDQEQYMKFCGFVDETAPTRFPDTKGVFFRIFQPYEVANQLYGTSGLRHEIQGHFVGRFDKDEPPRFSTARTPSALGHRI